MTDPQALSGGGELGEIPYLRLPRPEALFGRRAERFAALARGHTLSEYLEFLGRLAAAQRDACARTRPSLAGFELPRGPPLEAERHCRTEAWRRSLAHIVDALRAAPPTAEAQAAVALLAAMPPPELEALADRVLANAVRGAELATAPLVAAALQVYFVQLASQLSPESVPRSRDGCPVCGSLPVVAVVLGDDKLRYLVCSLCATQWHHTRVQCTACHEGKGIRTFSVEGGRGEARAEACPTCKAYTKLLYAEKDPGLEPLADDVATLALDLLMAEEGWARHGVNLLLVLAEERAPSA